MNKIQLNINGIAISFSVILAGIGTIVSATFLQSRNVFQSLLQWALFSGILFILWKITYYFREKTDYRYIGISLAFIVFFGYLNTLLFPEQLLFISFIRLFMPTLLFTILQQYFLSRERSDKLMIENLQLKAESYKAELENLKNQLNPHLLFNSLTTLQAIIRSDAKTAEKFVVELSKIYRIALQKVNHGKSTLKEEVEFIQGFLFLQKTRFENSIHYKIETEEKSTNYCLPTFALQLLVENCIKHNIVSTEKPLYIHIFQENPETITVTNNFQPKLSKTEESGIGLINLKRRYELFGIANGIVIENSDTLYKVTLTLF
ncbi:MAG: histidine kinase [Bacteroidia bacterium]|nr:histidine kinase [Bacteroidia bacterium]